MELVRGLGETLVGNAPGGALRFTADKARMARAAAAASAPCADDIPEGAIQVQLCCLALHLPPHAWLGLRYGAWHAQVVGYPSKSAALVLGDAGARGGMEPVLILRSDSSVEDLAGRARCQPWLCTAWQLCCTSKACAVVVLAVVPLCCPCTGCAGMDECCTQRVICASKCACLI